MRLSLLIILLFSITACTPDVQIALPVTISGNVNTSSLDSIDGSFSINEQPAIDTSTDSFIANETVKIYSRTGELLDETTTDSKGNFKATVFSGIDYLIDITSADGTKKVSAYIDKVAGDGRHGIVVNAYTSTIVYGMERHFNVSLRGDFSGSFYAESGYPGVISLARVATMVIGHDQFANLLVSFKEDLLTAMLTATDNSNNQQSREIMSDVSRRILQALIVDTTPPQNITSANFIENGIETINTRTVNLDIVANDNISLEAYFISESSQKPAADNTEWASANSRQDFRGTVQFTLSEGDGEKTLFVWFKDSSDNISTAVSDSIMLQVDGEITPTNTTDANSLKPKVTETSPADLSSNAPVNSVINIIFNMTIVNNAAELFTISPTIEGSIKWSENRTTLIFTPAIDFKQETKYTVTINSFATNQLEITMDSNHLFSFTTGSRLDTTPPKVIKSLPINNSVDIPASSSIVLQFSEKMEAGSINKASVTLINSLGSVEGKLEYHGKTAIFIPGVQLEYDTDYTLTLSTDVTDAADNGLAEAYLLGFKTAAENLVVDLKAGDNHNCILISDGRMKCWGLNNSTQIGTTAGKHDNIGDNQDEMGSMLVPVKLDGGPATGIYPGGFHTCTLVTDRSMFCWGDNSKGQIGVGVKLPIVSANANSFLESITGGNNIIINISTGLRHTCISDAENLVRCWGENTQGQLGTENIKSIGKLKVNMGARLKPVDFGNNRFAVKMVSRNQHNCALLDDATVKCWGGNLFGQLGYEDSDNKGDEPGEMGDKLPAVDLVQQVRDIETGSFHTCAILADNTIKCWGQNSEGQLGYGDIKDRGDNAGEMGKNLTTVNLGSGMVPLEITLGGQHTCVLFTNGTVKCWGRNSSGQLGYGDTVNRGDNIDEMGDNLPTVNMGTGRTAKAVVAGKNHTCALLDDYSVKCWGDNSSGQLGYGDTVNRGDNINEMADNLAAVSLM